MLSAQSVSHLACRLESLHVERFSQAVAPSRVQWQTSLGSEYEDGAAVICEARDGSYLLTPQ